MFALLDPTAWLALPIFQQAEFNEQMRGPDSEFPKTVRKRGLLASHHSPAMILSSNSPSSLTEKGCHAAVAYQNSIDGDPLNNIDGPPLGSSRNLDGHDQTAEEMKEVRAYACAVSPIDMLPG